LRAGGADQVAGLNAITVAPLAPNLSACRRVSSKDERM
jgi:hypothetical protein